MAPTVDPEGVVQHYLSVYKAPDDRVDVGAWVRLMKDAVNVGEHALVNPFDPAEKNHHQVLEWMPLADFDELLFGTSTTDAATCVAWWLCNTNWQAYRSTREEALWRRVLKKAYLHADLKKIKITPKRLLGVISKEPWVGEDLLQYLKNRRTALWPERSKLSDLKAKMAVWKAQRKAKKTTQFVNQELDNIVLRGKTFEPRGRAGK